MLSEERGRLLTHTGPGTPGGALLRRYWQPVALLGDLPADGSPLPMTIMGEELAIFRDDAGRFGVIALRCSHRGCDLSYGRVEDGGLRCVFHGWLFDVAGNCLEQPGEPEGSQLYKDVRHPAYPACERGGVIFAYLGTGAPPVMPELEHFTVPEAHRVSIKVLQECNYLQGVEGNIDPVHQSFLHRFLGDTAETAELAPRASVGGTTSTNLSLYRKLPQPKIEIEETAFGARFFICRELEDGGIFLRLYNFVMPNYCVIPGAAGSDGNTIHCHVPIDDEHHWKFKFSFTRSVPIDRKRLARSSFPELDARGEQLRTRSNRYLQNREEMKNRWFAGVGAHFADHDTFANEAQGPIQDRTREYLGYGDGCIVKSRRLLLTAIEDLAEGKVPLGVIVDAQSDWSPDLLVVAEAFAAGDDWHTTWKTRSRGPLQPAKS